MKWRLLVMETQQERSGANELTCSLLIFLVRNSYKSGNLDAVLLLELRARGETPQE
jgi:hypothetical protein